jgi:hypothetical protein
MAVQNVKENLTLTKKQNIFDNIKCEEEFNEKKLKSLITCDFIDDDEKIQLKKYIKNSKNGKCQIQYKNDFFIGTRVWSNGINSFSRKTRNTLTMGLYYDLDIVNSSPSILYNVLKNADLIPNDCLLETYINDRDLVLNHFMDIYNTSKDIAKMIFIAVMNGGNFKKLLKDNKIEFNKECDLTEFQNGFIDPVITELIEANNEMYNEVVKQCNKNKKTNYKGAFMAHYLFNLEREIMEHIYLYCVEKGIIQNNNFIYMFDGLMLKCEFIDEKDQFILQIEDLILNKMGFTINFKFKDAEEHYNNELLSNNLDFTDNIHDNELYLKQKNIFEKDHGAFKLENPMSFCVFDKTNNEIVQYNDKAIATYCEDKFDKIRENEKKFKSFIDVWREDKTKKSYKKMVFDPTNLTNEINYNHYKGFKYDNGIDVSKMKDENFAFFRLLRFLSPTDTEYNFTKSWFSHILKNPSKKTNCAIVLYSKLEGVGKNMLIDTFIKLIDDYFGLIKQIEDIKKNFNVDLCNKFLIYGDEITANAKLLVDRIKDSITASKIKLEKKGFDAVTLRDYSNWIFTTNNENCFKISPEDRRFFMFHCNEEKEKPKFYENVKKEMEDPIMMNKLFMYLKNYDDKNEFKIGSGIIPKTEYKTELIMADKPAYIQIFYKKPDLFINRECKSADLFKETQIYAKNNYLSSNYSITTFGLYMSKIFGNYKKRHTGGIVYDMPAEEEYLKLIYEADKPYYKYINGFDKNENPF